MRTTTIGALEVSVIGLGCNNFGRALDAAGTSEVVDVALEAGMNFFDTASNYGEGLSESFLGAALGDKRDQVVIAVNAIAQNPNPAVVQWRTDRARMAVYLMASSYHFQVQH